MGGASWSGDGPARAGPSATPRGWPRTVIDAVGREVVLPRRPERIVSLVPSTTETLHDLGLGARVVGRTRYCILPRPWVDTLPAVGGTKRPDVAAIAALQPDLILVNEEENTPRLYPRLEPVAPFAVAFPRGLDGVRDELLRLGALTGAEDAAAARVAELDAARDEAGAVAAPFTFACLIWKGPWMAANDDTYVSALLAEVGGTNVVTGGARYPELTLDELTALDPDLVLLPGEPYPFTAEHVPELGALAARARLVHGEMTTWHGTRTTAALRWFAAWRATGADLGER